MAKCMLFRGAESAAPQFPLAWRGKAPPVAAVCRRRQHHACEPSRPGDDGVGRAHGAARGKFHMKMFDLSTSGSVWRLHEHQSDAMLASCANTTRDFFIYIYLSIWLSNQRCDSVPNWTVGLKCDQFISICDIFKNLEIQISNKYI